VKCKHEHVFTLVTQNKAVVKWCQMCGGLKHPDLRWLLPPVRKPEKALSKAKARTVLGQEETCAILK